jgi:hypothetical protein
MYFNVMLVLLVKRKKLFISPLKKINFKKTQKIRSQKLKAKIDLKKSKILRI